MVQQRPKTRQSNTTPNTLTQKQRAEIKKYRQQMRAIESEVPKLRSLFQKTRLFSYLETPELQERFLNTVFYGLVATEGSFGTFTRHLTESGLKKLKKLKIKAKIFKSWTMLRVHDETREIPQATLQRYGIANQSALAQLIKECTIDKGVYQITPINLEDIGDHVHRGALKKVWGTRVGTWENDADRTNLEKARKLSVLSFERIYEMCRKETSTRYMRNRKQSLAAPIMIMGYSCGGGAAQKLLNYANEEKFTSNALWETIDWGIRQGIINDNHKHYLKRILFLRNQLQPNISQLEQNENQKSQIISKSKKAREKLNEEVLENNLTTTQPAQNEIKTSINPKKQPSSTTERQTDKATLNMNPSINFPTDLNQLEYKTIQMHRDLHLPSRPYLDPSIERNPEMLSAQFENQANQQTFGSLYLDSQNRTVDQVTTKELAISIIQQFTPRFSASQSSAGKTEIYKFPFGIEFKNISTKANTNINILKYNQNLKELYSETHLNYYNNWPVNPGYSLLPNTDTPAPTSPSPNKIQPPPPENAAESNELTWADIFNESNPIKKFSDSDVQYFILDTFMPERETEITPNGTTIHTDTYPFRIVVKTTINKDNNVSFQSMPMPDPSLRKELLRTPLKNYPRKPINIDNSYDVN